MIGKTMLFNPFTGSPRHPDDIKSDPAGILVWDGEEPLIAARASLPKPATLCGGQQCANAGKCLGAEQGNPCLPKPADAAAVWIVATGEVYEGRETYTRHDVRPPLCDAEKLYAASPARRVGLTEEQITGAFWSAFRNFPSTANALTYTAWKDGIDITKFSPPTMAFVRAIEAAHGITPAGVDGGGA